jgi:hypothetical protein
MGRGWVGIFHYIHLYLPLELDYYSVELENIDCKYIPVLNGSLKQ